MGQVWRDGQILRVERRAPFATHSGKILHLHLERRPALSRFDDRTTGGRQDAAAGPARASSDSPALPATLPAEDGPSRFRKRRNGSCEADETWPWPPPCRRGRDAARPAAAQTTLTMSSWVSPQHHLTSRRAAGLGQRGREGHQRPRQVHRCCRSIPRRRPAPSTRSGTASWTSPTSPRAIRRRATSCRSWPSCRARATRRSSTRSPTRASTGSTSTRSASTRA